MGGALHIAADCYFSTLVTYKEKQDDALLNKSMADNEAVRIKVRNLMKNAPVLDEPSNDQSKQD